MKTCFSMRLVASCVVLLVAAYPAAGQVESGRGGVARPELHAVGYLVGEWTVRSFERSPGGPWVESPATTSYRARVMYDGLSILAEFYGPNPAGFYGVHLISAQGAGFVHQYLNAAADRRLEFRGTFEDGSYHLERPGGYGGGDFLYRETDSEIEPESFVKRTYRSLDGGRSWEEADYYFRFERVR